VTEVLRLEWPHTETLSLLHRHDITFVTIGDALCLFLEDGRDLLLHPGGVVEIEL